MKALTAILMSWGPLGILVLSALDSAGIPVPAVVDVSITTMAALEPRRAYLFALMAVVSSLAGSLFLFHLARKGGQRYLDRYTLDGRGAKFKLWFLRYGMITVFIPALLPIPMPLKVFVLSAGAFGVKYRTFTIVFLLARIPRFFGLAYLGAQLGEHSGAWLKTHSVQIALFAVLLFAFLFLLVKISERFHKRPA